MKATDRAWIHIPALRSYQPIHVVDGRWVRSNDLRLALTGIPTLLAQAFQEDLDEALVHNILSGCPQGLAFEVVARPQADPFLLQQFGLAVLDRMEADEEWNSDTIEFVGCLATEWNLAHSDEESLFRVGPKPEPLHKGDLVTP